MTECQSNLATTLSPVPNTVHEAAQAGRDADPVCDLFVRWVATRREWYNLSHTCPNLDSQKMQTLSNKASALFSQMTETTAQSLDGLNCLARLLWEDCGSTEVGEAGNERSDPELRLKRQILLSAENLASIPTWQPLDNKMIPANAF